ncbi:MAG: hypothetical protein HYZ85_03280, partial [Candidatus Omnitrophica bacterium]|nr:hypothetical protein [Candidatus Omnitrophota bacterium]
FLSSAKQKLTQLSNLYLSKDLREFLKREENFEKDHLPPKDWIFYLKKQAEKYLETDLANPSWQLEWPMLYRMMKLSEIESKLDMNAFGAERKAFLKMIKMTPKPIYREVERLLKSTLSQSQLPDPETGLLFEKMIHYLPRSFDSEGFPNVKLFIGHLILQSELDGSSLFAEMNALSGRIIRKLAASSREKYILRLLNDDKLLTNLFALELTPEDFERVQSRKKFILPSKFSKRLKTLSRHSEPRKGEESRSEIASSASPPRNDNHSVIASPVRGEVNLIFNQAVAFYEEAKARDRIMLENIEKRLRETGQTKAAVVTGGFHAGPFKEYFESRGYRYALITPKLENFDGRENYVESVLRFVSPAITASTWETAPFVHSTKSELRELGFDGEKVKSEIRKHFSALRSEMRADLPTDMQFMSAVLKLNPALPSDREVLFTMQNTLVEMLQNVRTNRILSTMVFRGLPYGVQSGLQGTQLIQALTNELNLRHLAEALQHLLGFTDEDSHE